MLRSRRSYLKNCKRGCSNHTQLPITVKLSPQEEELKKKIAVLLECNANPLQMSMSHVFKAKTPSSDRGRLVSFVVAKTGVYHTVKQRRRSLGKKRMRSLIGSSLVLNGRKFPRPRTRKGVGYRLKKKALASTVDVMKESKSKAMSRERIKALSPLFFNGNNETSNIVGVLEGANIFPVTDLFIVDTKLGFRYPLNEEEDHIILLPRCKVIENHPRVPGLLTALECAQDNSSTSLKRGGQKIVAFQSCDSKYINPGVYPKRAGKGISMRTLQKMPRAQWKILLKYVKFCEQKAYEYLNGKFLCGFGMARKVVSFPTFPGPPHLKSSDMFSTIAAAKDVCLNSHTDDDTIYSLVSTMDCNHSTTFDMDDPVCCYFTFPELGVAVALRPGDILVFNPRTYHSVSSRCNNNQHIWCMSLYLKTALVGGNNNSLPLNALQNEIKRMVE